MGFEPNIVSEKAYPLRTTMNAVLNLIQLYNFTSS